MIDDDINKVVRGGDEGRILDELWRDCFLRMVC